MTLQQFLATYRVNFTITNQGNVNLILVTQVIRRSDNIAVDGVRTSIDIQDTNNWIGDSQTAISLTPWDWNKLIDQTKRAQLDYFALRIPIVDFFPMNTETDISIL